MNRNLTKLKYFVEEIHRAPFYNLRPLWLSHPDTSEPIVLDLYNPKLNKVYLISGDDDSVRIRLCEEHGISTVLVPKGLTVVGSD